MAGAGGKSSGPVRVMVVDDSSVVRGFLVRFIEEEQELFVAASVPNGEAALRALDEAAPDVVLLDLEMPVMDGLTALPLLLERRPKLPVVIVSTRTRENAALALRCLQMGASDAFAPLGGAAGIFGKKNAHEKSGRFHATAFSGRNP